MTRKRNGNSDDRVAQRVNAQAAALQSEFERHVAEVQRERPDMTEVALIFEGWIVQKIAGLQCVIITLSEKVAALESKRRKNT